MVIAVETANAKPAADPAVAVGLLVAPAPFPPAPPIPTIKPLFTSETPPGKEPLTVSAAVPVEFDEMYMPEPIVAATLVL
jgi:hypothetical protein